MNERLCNIRRRIMRELEDEEKVDLKGKRWHFNRNEENLCKQAREELESCCHLYQELGIAHGLKEALRRIYKIRDVVFVENALVYWCEKADLSDKGACQHGQTTQTCCGNCRILENRNNISSDGGIQ